MKYFDPRDSLDLIAEHSDLIEVEVQDRVTGKVLYIHVNGVTVLRICRIKEDNLNIKGEV